MIWPRSVDQLDRYQAFPTSCSLVSIATITFEENAHVDAHPDRKKRVGRIPLLKARDAVDTFFVLVDLLDERKNRGRIRLDERSVRGRATRCEVVGVDRAGVELGGVEANPICAAGGRPAGVCRVAERVGGVGKLECWVKAGLGVAIAATYH